MGEYSTIDHARFPTDVVYISVTLRVEAPDGNKVLNQVCDDFVLSQSAVGDVRRSASWTNRFGTQTPTNA